MNILITGAAGFIGWNLYNQLKTQNHKIALIDNFSTSNNKQAVHNLDISVYSEELEALVKTADVIYHLAGSVGVKKIDSEYHKSLMNSININNILFELCEKHCTKVIFASTSEVYGECTNAKETDTLQISSPEFGRGSYSCAKLMSEFILKSYSFPSTIVRFFNVVGKGQIHNYGMVIPTFMKNAKESKPLIVHNKGTQVRSYCCISDAVIMLNMLLDEEHNNKIYNIGNTNNKTTVKELAELIIDLTNSKSKIIYKDTDQVFSKEFFEINERSVCTDKFNKFYKAEKPLHDIIKGLI